MRYLVIFFILLFPISSQASGKLNFHLADYVTANRIAPQIDLSVYESILGDVLVYNGSFGYGRIARNPSFMDDEWISAVQYLETTIDFVTIAFGYRVMRDMDMHVTDHGPSAKLTLKLW